jgi:hypothetical protein
MHIPFWCLVVALLVITLATLFGLIVVVRWFNRRNAPLGHRRRDW